MRVQFGEFCLDSDRRELSKTGQVIHLTPKAFELLRLLIERRPTVVSKEELHQDLWPETFVEESNLSVLVSEVRSALADEPRQPRFIKTAHRYGYGFIAGVREQKGIARDASLLRIRCGTREIELAQGENILGRDADVTVRLDSPGISRRHARITVSGEHAFIEDLGSKNGTFVQGQRVEGRRDLHDGDEIRLARELLVVLAPSRVASTVTDTG